MGDIKMNIEFLHEYLALARCLNFSIAADYLFITQPALSRHVALMEKELQVKLFERDTRSVVLTKYGEIFLSGAKNIISSYDNTLEEIRLTTNDFEKTLNVGFLNGAVNNLLVPLTTKFIKLYPKVKLNFFSYEYYEIHKALLLNEINIAFTQRLEFPHANELEFRDIYKDPLLVILRIDHPLAGQNQISLSELKNEKFLLPDEQHFPGYWKLIEKLCADSGFKPLTDGIVFQVQTAPVLIEAGSGICITPMHLKSLDTPNLAYVPLSNQDCYTVICAAYKKDDHNPIHASFIKLIDSYVAKIKSK
jgi:DNA-binding transcriptional LysR family regulator